MQNLGLLRRRCSGPISATRQLTLSTFGPRTSSHIGDPDSGHPSQGPWAASGPRIVPADRRASVSPHHVARPDDAPGHRRARLATWSSPSTSADRARPPPRSAHHVVFALDVRTLTSAPRARGSRRPTAALPFRPTTWPALDVCTSTSAPRRPHRDIRTSTSAPRRPHLPHRCPYLDFGLPVRPRGTAASSSTSASRSGHAAQPRPHRPSPPGPATRLTFAAAASSTTLSFSRTSL